MGRAEHHHSILRKRVEIIKGRTKSRAQTLVCVCVCVFENLQRDLIKRVLFCLQNWSLWVCIRAQKLVSTPGKYLGKYSLGKYPR